MRLPGFAQDHQQVFDFGLYQLTLSAAQRALHHRAFAAGAQAKQHE